jgi:hypothetical protein
LSKIVKLDGVRVARALLDFEFAGAREWRTPLTGCGKTQGAVILSGAKNLSLIVFLFSNRREILRFAQNDETRHFFRSLK